MSGAGTGSGTTGTSPGGETARPTRSRLLAATFARYGAPEAVNHWPEARVERFLLVETGAGHAAGRLRYSTHASPAAAELYHDGQGRPDDWRVRAIVDLAPVAARERAPASPAPRELPPAPVVHHRRKPRPLAV
jgi:hypothetical protein